jgi:hypothetical protein
MSGYSNSLPYEIIAAPYDLFYAVVGTAFPLIDAVPSASWLKVGSSGNLNYDDGAGVKVSHQQKINLFRALGDAGCRKTFRTEEDLMIDLVLNDVTLEQYQHALNSNAVATNVASSGVAGFKKIGMSRGFAVATVALLVRGPSPYGDQMTLQYEVPRAAQTGNPQVVFKKDTPVGLALQWTALVDPNASTPAERFGRLVAQHQLAL